MLMSLMDKTPKYYHRSIESRIDQAMVDTPIVLVTGPRQVGKTTLARQVANDKGLQYITLDDQLALQLARADPVGMVRGLRDAMIDEVQRAPDLLLALKKSVYEDRLAGRFLLTASAHLMTLPTTADSLAGRMETLTLLPLSQSELHSETANWIESAFAGQFLDNGTPLLGEDLVHRVLCGGYPEALSRPSVSRRNSWGRQYLDSLIQRDVREIAQIQRLSELPQLLRAVAQTAGQLCNYSNLGGQLGLDSKTAAKYMDVFEQLYLLKRVDVWSNHRLQRVVKSPKLQFIDSGILSLLLGLTAEETRSDRTRFGQVLETFVYGELLKHASASDQEFRLMYYRDAGKLEVDVIIENARGELLAVEVKASATVKASDFKGLRRFADLAGPVFKSGVVLYDGDVTMPMGHGLWAVPLSSLWGH